MPSDVEVFEDQANLFVGRLENCAVVVWRQTPTIESSELAARHFPRFEQNPGQGFGLAAVITPACAPVGPEVRETFASAMNAHRDAALAMAAIIEVQGVLGGLTRALARTMSVISRSPYPTNVFAAPDEGARWLSDFMHQRGSMNIDPARLVRYIEEHRRFAP